MKKTEIQGGGMASGINFIYVFLRQNLGAEVKRQVSVQGRGE
jgi:hypothetical protein